MSKNGDRHLPEILAKHETMLLSEWLKEQLVAGIRRDDLMREGEMRDQSGEFLRLLRDASQGGNLTNYELPRPSKTMDEVSDVSSRLVA